MKLIQPGQTIYENQLHLGLADIFDGTIIVKRVFGTLSNWRLESQRWPGYRVQK